MVRRLLVEPPPCLTRFRCAKEINHLDIVQAVDAAVGGEEKRHKRSATGEGKGTGGVGAEATSQSERRERKGKSSKKVGKKTGMRK